MFYIYKRYIIYVLFIYKTYMIYVLIYIKYSPGWGDMRRRLATWLNIKPQLKCYWTPTILSAFTMVVGHYNRYTKEGLLPCTNALA